MQLKKEHLLSLSSRGLISTIFIVTGLNKFTDRKNNLQYVKSKGLPGGSLLLGAAGLVELLGGPSVLLGLKGKRVATLLALYLVPVSLLMHDFWNEEGQQKQADMINFLKNLAIIGGLIEIANHGTGELSLERPIGKLIGRISSRGAAPEAREAA